MDVTVVEQGAWEFALGMWVPALVLESTRDFWHELGQAESQLNDDGVVYYYALRALDTRGFWPASPAYPSREEARKAVEGKVDVEWGREPSPAA